MTKSGYLVTGAPHALSLLAFETQTIRFWTRVHQDISSFKRIKILTRIAGTARCENVKVIVELFTCGPKKYLT